MKAKLTGQDQQLADFVEGIAASSPGYRGVIAIVYLRHNTTAAGTPFGVFEWPDQTGLPGTLEHYNRTVHRWPVYLAYVGSRGKVSRVVELRDLRTLLKSPMQRPRRPTLLAAHPFDS